ncbi:D-alanyl-D-alanine carboxypeptidase (penicillin-binding protein 5/6) [Bosea sp. BE125]|uniref:D-alanyl-D-alanine carboxypeptidase family protein n=1 Tax=Bosea sp. BE125 TaxID=2817909 RepID=UPI002855AACB|nr:D-alanyl-D-alanine carboxypeptidase family protein [Bosea sp. BE125]MDR6870101.1 D-alanyl-D-alanine carboxypeptidase (penicillin-binding protein 5/6) [Bosea sp. BE125]
MSAPVTSSDGSDRRSAALRLGVVAFLSLVLSLVGTGLRAQNFQSPAPYAVLLDSASGTVLYEKAADELMVPASLAKIATALVAFQEITQGRLTLDSEIGISENAWRKGGGVSGGSTMFAILNSRVKLSDILQGLIVQSGNDAAIALAEAIAGDEPTFARVMTERVRALGLTKSVFRNATGVGDPEQKVTARELARLADHIIKTYPELYKIFGQREFTWNKIKQQNRNPLLAMEIGADGLKTGNIDEAGFGLVGSAVQNGQRLIVVVNGLKTARDRAQEARKLLEWGFRAFEARKIFGEDEIVGEASVFGGAKGRVALKAKGPVSLLLPRGAGERLNARIVYRGPLVAPVQEGAEVGRLLVTRGEVKTLEVPLYAAETVESGTLQRRALDAVMELATGWVRKVLKRS